jgi:putative SOS response-associated peptidase YedK
MCGRVVSTTPSGALAGIFGAETALDPEDRPDWNVAPTTRIRAVADDGGGRRIGRYRWGLVPRSAEQVGAGPLMINARAETVTSKPIFAQLLSRRRCVVPVDGFYEWQRLPGGKKKQPFFLHPADGAVFALADLWDVWSGSEGEPVPSLTILTTAANETVTQVHDRMPVILPTANWDAWLDRGLRDVEALRSMLVPAAPGVVVLHPVADTVNNVRNNSADLVVAVEPVSENTLF